MTQTFDQYLSARLTNGAADLAGLAPVGLLKTKTLVGVASNSIEIPFRHPMTGETVLRRYRILAAPSDGKKFLQPKGTGLHLYFPPLPKKPRRTWKQVLADPTVPIGVTEGEIKALAATHAGHVTVAITGKDCATKDGKLIADWDLLELGGRSVTVTPDFDFSWKPDVRRSWIKTAEALAERGAVVGIRLLHDVTGTGVCGVDDFLRARTPEDFDALPRYGFDGPVCAKWRAEAGAASALPQMALAPFPAEWVTVAPPKQEFTVDGWLPRGTVGLVVASGGIGKTYLVMDMAAAVATGEPWFGFATRKGRVVYLALEDPPEILRRRVHSIYENRLGAMRRAFTAAMAENLVIESLVGQQLHLIGLKDNVVVQAPTVDALIARLRHDETELLVLDPMARLHGLNENDNSVGTAFVNSVERVAREVGCTVLVLHHTGKANARDKAAGAHAARGASGISDAARVVMRLRRLDEDEANAISNLGDEERARGVVVLSHEKSNYSARVADLHLRRDELGYLDAFKAEFKDSPRAPDAMEAKLRAWAAERAAPFTPTDVVNAKLFGKASGREFVNRLIASGALVATGEKTRGRDTYRFAAEVPGG